MRDDREPGRSGAGVAILLVVVLFFLPALYILSCGPAVALMSRGYLSEGVFEVVYYPLSVAANSSDWISTILESYADLWAA
jgi:hypothetical protein